MPMCTDRWKRHDIAVVAMPHVVFDGMATSTAWPTEFQASQDIEARPSEPTSLPIALVSKCKQLQSLLCAGMWQLTDISGLPCKLRVLHIGGCRDISDFTPLLKCTALTTLGLQGAYAHANAHSLAPTLRQLTSLQSLCLNHSFWGQSAGSSLAPVLSALTGLTCLELKHQHLSSGVLEVAQTLSLLTNLQHLDLTGNSLCHNSVTALLAAHLGAPLKQLTCLILATNFLTASDAAWLGPALSAMPSLRSLDLSENNITSDGVMALGPALVTLPLLTSLNLRGNVLKAAGALWLAPVILAHPQLEFLDVACNWLGKEGIDVLKGVQAAACGLVVEGLELGEEQRSPAGAGTAVEGEGEEEDFEDDWQEVDEFWEAEAGEAQEQEEDEGWEDEEDEWDDGAQQVPGPDGAWVGAGEGEEAEVGGMAGPGTPEQGSKEAEGGTQTAASDASDDGSAAPSDREEGVPGATPGEQLHQPASGGRED